jgi:hypothetical protein
MHQLIRFSLIIALLLPGVLVSGSVPHVGGKFSRRGKLVSDVELAPALKDVALQVQDLPPGPRKFEEFGDVNCEDEMARLDNLAVQLKDSPAVKGLIIFYGGRRFRDQLPKRGEAAARAARLRTYLLQRRGIPKHQLLMIDGGYAEEWHVEIWLVPPGAKMPSPQPTIPANQIKFRKGKINPRDYRCEI